jgi:predicted tellurium resistance membrane protein TerC
MEWITDPTVWLGLLTLIALEIVLGIDNLVFIAILTDRLPAQQRHRARLIGLSLALLMRLALLASISWLAAMTAPLFRVFGVDVSGRGLVMLAGGAFLLSKATLELHQRLEGAQEEHSGPSMHAGLWPVILQIVIVDVVFSLDSVITAVGMVDQLELMVIAVVVAVAIMMVASRRLMDFVSAHPTVIVLCLGFLLMIGFSLVLEGFNLEIPKGYLYAAIGFSVLIETFNQLAQRNRQRALAQRRDLRARAADAVLRLLGAGQSGPAPDQADVAALVAQAGSQRLFEAAERKIVRSAFELSERPVQSIMTPRDRIEWLDVSEPRDRLLERLQQVDHSRFPLARGGLGALIGVARARDLLAHIIEHTGKLDGLARPPLYIHENTDILELLRRFKSSPMHFAVVVNEHATIRGIATPMDVLEAIVGDLPQSAAPAARQDTGRPADTS